MKDEFRAMLDARMSDYRKWLRNQRPSGCRWVHYTGVEMTGACDVPLDEVEARLTNAMREGFHAGWAEHQGRIYVRIWEGDAEPPWKKVFAEESLVDVSEILRRAGFSES